MKLVTPAVFFALCAFASISKAGRSGDSARSSSTNEHVLASLLVVDISATSCPAAL